MDLCADANSEDLFKAIAMVHVQVHIRHQAVRNRANKSQNWQEDGAAATGVLNNEASTVSGKKQE